VPRSEKIDLRGRKSLEERGRPALASTSYMCRLNYMLAHEPEPRSDGSHSRCL
jgi:hypothetical protein